MSKKLFQGSDMEQIPRSQAAGQIPAFTSLTKNAKSESEIFDFLMKNWRGDKIRTLCRSRVFWQAMRSEHAMPNIKNLYHVWWVCHAKASVISIYLFTKFQSWYFCWYWIFQMDLFARSLNITTANNYTNGMVAKKHFVTRTF